MVRASASDFPISESAAIRFYLAGNEADPGMHRLTMDEGNAGSNRWAAVPMGALVLAGFDDIANQIVSYEIETNDELELFRTDQAEFELQQQRNRFSRHYASLADGYQR